MSLLARAGEAIRNSPLMARKNQPSDYALAQDDDYDPFVQGVTFYCEFMHAKPLPPDTGRPDQVHAAIVEDLHRNAKQPFKNYSILVKDKSIRLKDVANNQVTGEIPIHLICYCGTHQTLDRSFCLIYRHSDSNTMYATLLRAADRPKAQAMVKTVSKAFNIAYSAWQAKRKEQQRSSLAANTDSPRYNRKLGELKKPAAKPSPMVQKKEAEPVVEVTEKMGQITVTVPKTEDDELEDEFTSLAASRSHPDLLASDVGSDPNQFSWAETKAHADPGSSSNLLDL